MTAPNNPDPDSYRNGKIGKIATDRIEVVQVWKRSEPGARQYVIDEIMPEKAITAVYGDGGNGKTQLAMAAATCIVTGRAFLGRGVTRGPVLYVDAELEAEEFTRRAYRVARGMGLDQPPQGLYYLRLPGSLNEPGAIDNICRVVDELAPVLVILDSVMAASYGADLERANDTTAILKQIESWGTVLTIDHIAKPAPGANLSQYRQYGSVFKFNLARSVLQIVQADGGGLVVRQTKHNFGPKAEPFGVAMDFAVDRVTFTAIETDDIRLTGITQHLPAPERVLLALSEHPDGATPEEIADELEMSPKTVQNHLTTLKRRGRADNDNRGTWRLPNNPDNPDPIGTGTGIIYGDGNNPDPDAGKDYQDYPPLVCTTPGCEKPLTFPEQHPYGRCIDHLEDDERRAVFAAMGERRRREKGAA